MTDPTTAHINKGTGGNFTLNGTIARSGRGPNQDNCVASEFDGSADYLSKSGSIGAVTGKSFTFSFNVKAVDLGLIGYIGFLVGTTNIFSIAIDPDLRQNFILNEADGTNAAYARLEYVDLLRRNISLQIESDSSGTLKIYLNDTDISGTIVWITSPTGQDYGFGSIDTVFIGRSAAASTIISGTIGEVYFHTPKLGLSAANHFFDSDTNKPIPVRQVIETTGVTPLIAMPLRADNPGKNLGSGGDFTEYSAPFAGARGASEFWARSMHSDGTTDYLSKTSTLTGSADGKTVTLVGAWYPDDVTGNEELFNISTAIPAQRFQAQRTGTTLTIKGWNASGTEILNVTVASFFAATTWVTLLASIDLSNSSNRSIYKDGVVSTPTWTTYTDDNIELSAAHSTLCAADAGAGFYDGMTGFFYFDASYIDFSQESNRLLFIDAFDYPTDIENQISDGNVTNPLILMLMKNTASFGTNSGAGGNYTVNGTPVCGRRRERINMTDYFSDYFAAVDNGEIKAINLPRGGAYNGKRFGKLSPDSTYILAGLLPIVGTQPAIDTSTQRISGITYEVAGQRINKVYAIEDIPAEEIKTRLLISFENNIQNILDETAREKGYGVGSQMTPTLSICTYTDDPNPKFASEASAFKTWRSAVWTHCYTVMADIENGLREIPSWDELKTELPEMVWPN